MTQELSTFKAALDEMPQEGCGNGAFDIWARKHRDEIRAALELAERMQRKNENAEVSDCSELQEGIPTRELIDMLREPPENVKWTGDFGLFQRAAWRIEELDGQFAPRFIVPRARYGRKVHEAVSEIATNTFINYPTAVRVNGEWLKPDQFQVSIGAIGSCIQAYLDFFTAVQDGEEDAAPENSIDVGGKDE